MPIRSIPRPPRGRPISAIRKIRVRVIAQISRMRYIREISEIGYAEVAIHLRIKRWRTLLLLFLTDLADFADLFSAQSAQSARDIFSRISQISRIFVLKWFFVEHETKVRQSQWLEIVGGAAFLPHNNEA